MVPVPDNESIPEEMIVSAIEKAKATIIKNHITGKEFTPIMLKSIVDVTEGKSLDANIALIKNNAAIGASSHLTTDKIAIAIPIPAPPYATKSIMVVLASCITRTFIVILRKSSLVSFIFVC